MFGYLSFAPQGERLRGGVRPETKTICGVRFFAVSVEQSRSRMVQARRLRRAARIMERAGVRAALFPAGSTCRWNHSA